MCARQRGARSCCISSYTGELRAMPNYDGGQKQDQIVHDAALSLLSQHCTLKKAITFPNPSPTSAPHPCSRTPCEDSDRRLIKFTCSSLPGHRNMSGSPNEIIDFVRDFLAAGSAIWSCLKLVSGAHVPICMWVHIVYNISYIYIYIHIHILHNHIHIYYIYTRVCLSHYVCT